MNLHTGVPTAILQAALFFSILKLGKINRHYSLSMKIVLALCPFITIVAFML